MAGLTLVIGNKNYSSWSMRPWLALKAAAAEFEEVVIPLYRPESKKEILRYSPSGFVPVLLKGNKPIAWDSLAICEYAAETYPAARLWPKEAGIRAHARSSCAEMHSGFTALRSQCPMDMKKRETVSPSPELLANVARIEKLWGEARAFALDGDFLYGHFTVADAFYAPVVSRFASYGIEVNKESRRYMNAVWAWPAFAAWREAAEKEPWVI